MSNAINPCNINHIAFIMDGNGRWAKKRLMPREYGHVEGAKISKSLFAIVAMSAASNVSQSMRFRPKTGNVLRLRFPP